LMKQVHESCLSNSGLAGDEYDLPLAMQRFNK
jgi:hypothetical protein